MFKTFLPKRNLISLLLVTGTLCLVTVTEVKEAQAQFLTDYETKMIDIIKCNDRSGFDTSIMEGVASLIRLKLFFIGILLVTTISFYRNGTVVKMIISILIAFSSVNLIYERGIATHLEKAKNMSAMTASQSQSSVNSGDSTVVVVGGSNDGTEITNPPSNSRGAIILPPPPPLDGISTGSIEGNSGEVVCTP